MASLFYSFVDYCRHPAVPCKKVDRCSCSPRPMAAALPQPPLLPHCPTSTAFRACAPIRLPPLPAQFGEAGDIETSNKRVWAALAAEFLGMLLFALYGGEARDSAASYGNGLALAVLVCECPGGWLAFR